MKRTITRWQSLTSEKTKQYIAIAVIVGLYAAIHIASKG
jgi:hypothetical protein